MSALSDIVFGQKQTASTVQDTTPAEFRNLRQPFAQQLLSQMKNPQHFSGPFTAMFGGAEQQALQGVQSAAQPVGLQGQGVGTYMNPFAQAVGPTGAEMQGLSAIQNQAFGMNPLQNTVNQQLMQIAGGGPNPMLDQLIQSATRPILENFGDAQLAQRGAFTGAGHQVQGRGSSPFAQASARLSGNAMNAVGDVSANLAGQMLPMQMQALQMGAQLPGMQLQNMLAGQQALGMPREIAQSGLNLQNQAFESQQGRQLQGNEQQTTNQMAQLQAQLQNLQAQGLPRMIQQLGIDAGLAQFNTQQQQLMQMMQLMGGMTAPNTQVVPGMQGTTGLAHSFLQGLSDRRMKRDIVHVATLPSGTKLYQFRYIEGDVTHIGVMADEVAHIPGAVMTDEITGLQTVDYRKVA